MTPVIGAGSVPTAFIKLTVYGGVPPPIFVTSIVPVEPGVQVFGEFNVILFKSAGSVIILVCVFS